MYEVECYSGCLEQSVLPGTTPSQGRPICRNGHDVPGSRPPSESKHSEGVCLKISSTANFIDAMRALCVCYIDFTNSRKRPRH